MSSRILLQESQTNISSQFSISGVVILEKWNCSGGSVTPFCVAGQFWEEFRSSVTGTRATSGSSDSAFVLPLKSWLWWTSDNPLSGGESMIDLVSAQVSALALLGIEVCNLRPLCSLIAEAKGCGLLGGCDSIL